MNDDDQEPTVRGPRHNVEFEQYVLGAVLLSGGRVLHELNLTGADFYRPLHEELWTLMVAMSAQGEPVESMSILGRLKENPILGMEAVYLHDLEMACSSWHNAAYYAERVSGLARLRRLQASSARLAHLAGTADPGEIENVVAAIRAEVDAAAQQSGGASSLVPFSDLFLRALDRWESTETGILPTGLHDVDKMLSGGLRPGHLMVIGARPAVGKSVVASVIAHTIAARGTSVLFSSLEMSRDEVVDRVAADIADIDLERLTRRALTDTDWEKASRALKKVAEWPLFIDDRANISVAGVRGRARDVSRRSPLGLIVVDYLQLMRPLDDRASRQEQVASVSRGLKLAAKELAVPIVALAQVNRGPTNRNDKRPMMSDLRESGAIEADADEIILLHRDDEESPGEIEFIIEKNRHGRTGRVALAWSPHYSRVASMAREYDR